MSSRTLPWVYFPDVDIYYFKRKKKVGKKSYTSTSCGWRDSFKEETRVIPSKKRESEVNGRERVGK